MALRLRRPIELAPAVIAATDHGAHCAIRRHRHEGPLAYCRLRPVARDGLGDCRFGFGLQNGIERRRDGEVATAGAGKIAELLGYPIGEIAGTRPRGGDDGSRYALFDGTRDLAFTDDAGLDHIGEDPSGTRGGLFVVAGRIELRRRLQ